MGKSEDERRAAYFLRNKSPQEINRLHQEAVRREAESKERASVQKRQALIKEVIAEMKHEGTYRP